MRRTTTEREFDDAGRLVKETTTTFTSEDEIDRLVGQSVLLNLDGKAIAKALARVAREGCVRLT